MNISLDIKVISTIIGILAGISGFGAWVYTYHTTLATKEDVYLDGLDNKISNVETNVLIYQLMGEGQLDAASKGRYERARKRLTSLEAQRDKSIDPSD